MAAGEIHVGDVGLVFEVAVSNDQGPLDLSAATATRLVFQKPDGTDLIVAAYRPNGGGDGLLAYATVDGDLDQVGTWRQQVYVEVGPLRVYSDVGKFKVHANL